MAIVTGNSNLYRSAQALDLMPDPHALAGVVRHAVGTVANASTDSSGSMYRLAKLPSYAILHPSTFFDVENWGFAQVVIGSRDITDQILDVARSAATGQSPFAWGDANHGKRLWEVLGMSVDPNGSIDLYAHAEANATGAGSMPFCIAWLDTI
ncbi:MAG: hypothetical protein VYD87_19835 [Pseudomonadota bacterium]|nr:hypothetical protein [Pseudomonadota bacterium]